MSFKTKAAGLIALVFVLTLLVSIVSASDIKHAEKAVILKDSRWLGHHALVFNLGYNSGWHPKVGGVGSYLNFILVPLDSVDRNAQNWDWIPYEGKSAMLIPTRYVLSVYSFNYANDIYVDNSKWIVSSKGYNVWQFC
jgi:hypothetical protein